jgi:CubicO group peptidase (beta-lactamase class C family)
MAAAFAGTGLCLLLLCVCFASARTTPQSILASYNFTGVAHAWRKPNVPVFETAQGYTNAKYRISMTLDAHFPIGSNTKLYMAVALYQLQEDGLVDLESSIGNYLNATDFCAFGYPNMTSYCPQVPGNASCQTITFVQLLSMTAGIPVNAAEEFMPYPGSIAQTFGSSLVAPLLFVPGTQYYYSNPSFNLAGYFVEKLSGMPLPQYLQRRIIEPLGLTSTYLDVYNGQFAMDEKRVDEFYQFIDPVSKALASTGVCTSEIDLGSVAGAGGMISTQRDEMVFYFTLFNFSDGAWGMPLLKNRSSLEAILKPRAQMGTDQYYAQGIAVMPWAARPTSLPPAYIFYEGGTMCVSTANWFDLTKASPTLTQVWSNTKVYYLNASDVKLIGQQDTGTIWEYLNAIPARTGLMNIAYNISTSLFGQ